MVPSHGNGEIESHDVEIAVGHTPEYFWVLLHKLAHMLAYVNLIDDGLAQVCTSIVAASEEYHMFWALNISLHMYHLGGYEI